MRRQSEGAEEDREKRGIHTRTDIASTKMGSAELVQTRVAHAILGALSRHKERIRGAPALEG